MTWCLDYIFKKIANDKMNTVKKKTKRGSYFWVVLVVALGSLALFFGTFYKVSDKVLSHKSDDDDKEDKGENNKNKILPTPSIYIQPTLSITVYPTVIVTPTHVQPTVRVTVSPVEPVATPTDNLETDNNDNSSSISQEPTQDSVQESSNQEEVVVPVSERSTVSTVTSSSSTRVAIPTKSIFKKIENKIKGVGGTGQFLNKPKKSSVSPTPTKKVDDFSSPVALGPDSSIFYMLTDTDLLLGAVDKEDKRINVDEAELRGAEITMNKVLAKNGLELGVSSGGSLVLTENGVRSYFDLPVFVDVFSHEISVDTANGKKQIKTTPAKAVVNAIESGYLENVDKKSQMVMGEINGGELAYRLEGDKEFKVLGRFNIKGAQYVYVDVETGEVSEGDQPLLSKFLKLISL